MIQNLDTGVSLKINFDRVKVKIIYIVKINNEWSQTMKVEVPVSTNFSDLYYMHVVRISPMESRDGKIMYIYHSHIVLEVLVSGK